MWEQIARQLIVIFGLSTLDKSTGEIIAEHERLLEALSSNSFARIQVALEEHIKLQNSNHRFRNTNCKTARRQSRKGSRHGRRAVARAWSC